MNRNNLGLAQIPLMIGLLLMAVAVPAVTKLVQENQNNQGRAAINEPCKICVSKKCVTVAKGNQCKSSLNECATNVNCGGVTPTLVKNNVKTVPTKSKVNSCNYNSKQMAIGEKTCLIGAGAGGAVYTCGTGGLLKIDKCNQGYTCQNGACVVTKLTPTPMYGCDFDSGRLPVGGRACINYPNSLAAVFVCLGGRYNEIIKCGKDEYCESGMCTKGVASIPEIAPGISCKLNGKDYELGKTVCSGKAGVDLSVNKCSVNGWTKYYDCKGFASCTNGECHNVQKKGCLYDGINYKDGDSFCGSDRFKTLSCSDGRLIEKNCPAGLFTCVRGVCQ